MAAIRAKHASNRLLDAKLALSHVFFTPKAYVKPSHLHVEKLSSKAWADKMSEKMQGPDKMSELSSKAWADKMSEKNARARENVRIETRWAYSKKIVSDNIYMSLYFVDVSKSISISIYIYI